MSLKNFFGILLAVFAILQLLFTSGFVSLAVFIEQRNFETTTKEKFQSLIESNRMEFINDLRLKDTEMLKARINSLKQEENLDLAITSSAFDYSTFETVGGSDFKKEYSLDDDGKILGKLSLVQKNPGLKTSALVPVLLFLALQLGLAFVVIYYLQKWTFNRVFLPLERLVESGRKGKVDPSITESDLIPEEVKSLSNIMVRLWDDIRTQSSQTAHVRIASQVAHDIRSPLSALEVLSTKFSDKLPRESSDLLITVTRRIREIAESLLQQKPVIHAQTKVSSGERQAQALSVVIKEILNEKRLSLIKSPGFKVEYREENKEGFFFANIDPSMFRRILSNLINNAVESYTKSEGLIECILRPGQKEFSAEIVIRDQGVGIPPEKISQVLQPGVSFGKAQGHGLGLSFAKETAEAWGGSLRIESQVAQGTDVIVELPRCAPPEYFLLDLKEPEGKDLVIIDDDDLVHQRIKSLISKPALHFKSSDEFHRWYFTQDLDEFEQNHWILCDYHLKDIDGLEMIERLKLTKICTMITSDHECLSLQKRAFELQIKILPKSLLFQDNIKAKARTSGRNQHRVQMVRAT